MSDADLEEIRRARLQQLRQQGGGGGGAGGEEGQEDQQKQREAEARSHILSQILTPDAADRLGRIRLVRESRATDVENRLIMLARSGQLRSKVTEDQLKDILTAISEQQGAKGGADGSGEGGGDSVGTIKVQRKRGGWDDDDDDDLL
ncbi:DNA-binding TFAR19-related protein, partial [Viridothelium virens]